MKVFLVRHAIAHDRNRKRWPNDALRPLTPAGKQKFRKAARGLATVLPKSAALLTSPFVRARHTADLLAREMGRKKIVEVRELASGEPAHEVFTMLRARKDKAVVLVGHEPNLSTLLSACLNGHARLKIDFKKGGAACIEFTRRIEPGRACLVWCIPPRVLRAMG
ncbi:MAG TPA: histidine phosphatase family protein [Steroidobacteraceae bacterium]|jgi:phosphohistidine phosphatase|nr:histidine phosphatase family protein [Steroidobacteraceae bacterium]